MKEKLNLKLDEAALVFRSDETTDMILGTTEEKQLSLPTLKALALYWFWESLSPEKQDAYLRRAGEKAKELLSNGEANDNAA